MAEAQPPRRSSHEKSDIGTLLPTDISYEEALAAITKRAASAMSSSSNAELRCATAVAPCTYESKEATPMALAALCTKADGMVRTLHICPLCCDGAGSSNSNSSSFSLSKPLARSMLSGAKWCFTFELLDTAIACSVSMSSMSHLLPFSVSCVLRDAILLRSLLQSQPSRQDFQRAAQRVSSDLTLLLGFSLYEILHCLRQGPAKSFSSSISSACISCVSVVWLLHRLQRFPRAYTLIPPFFLPFASDLLSNLACIIHAFGLRPQVLSTTAVGLFAATRLLWLPLWSHHLWHVHSDVSGPFLGLARHALLIGLFVQWPSWVLFRQSLSYIKAPGALG